MKFNLKKIKKVIYISVFIILIFVIVMLFLNKNLLNSFKSNVYNYEFKWNIYINDEQSDVIVLNDGFKEEQFNLTIKSEIDKTVGYSIELYGLQKKYIIELENQKENYYISYEFDEENNNLNIVYNDDKIVFDLNGDDFQHIKNYYMLKDKENIVIKNKNYQNVLNFYLGKNNQIKVIFENILKLKSNNQYEDKYFLNILSNDDELLQDSIKVYVLFDKEY